MAHEESIRVRFRDVDAMQHVNNAVYFTWMEAARTEYYMGLRKTQRVEDVDIIIARATCEYVRGVRLGETVTVRVWPSRVGTTSFDLSYDLRVGQELVARGLTVQVCFDYAAHAKKPVSSQLRKVLDAELEDAVVAA
jgi:acyl-CoA thioester hydrolase